VKRLLPLSREYCGKRVVIYPVYFDYNRSRREGRKVPRSLAIQNPSIEVIATVAKEIGLDPEISLEEKYPKDPTIRGRIVVNKYISKQQTLLLLAKALREKLKTTKTQ